MAKKDTTEHWKELVKVWFDFYFYHKKEEPTFKGAQSKNLKLIVENLRERAIKKGHEWDCQYACYVLNSFLSLALSNSNERKWAFLLPKINFYFDEIITGYRSKQNQRFNDIQGAIEQINKSFGQKGQC